MAFCIFFMRRIICPSRSCAVSVFNRLLSISDGIVQPGGRILRTDCCNKQAGASCCDNIPTLDHTAMALFNQVDNSFNKG
jgi:hypothetical protein